MQQFVNLKQFYKFEATVLIFCGTWKIYTRSQEMFDLHFLISSFLNDTHMEELDSVQKFIEVQGWLLLTFFICLQNQLRSFNSILVDVWKTWFIK